jgi:ABC-type glycerol-3-phosphate transport system permease component
MALAARAPRESRGDRAFGAANYAILSVLLVVTLYPLVFILSSSLSSPDAVAANQVWLWPVKPTVTAYQTVFRDPAVVTGFLNSIFYTVVGTALNVGLTLLAAYPLSRRDLPGRGLIIFLFLFTMLFSGGLIPTYLVVKDLHLVNTRWALILPEALGVWNVIITRTYFQLTIPHDLLEAARIDGADDLRFFWKVVLPLSWPIIAVNALFYAVGHWNQFFSALIYLTDQGLFPLQLVLQQILVQHQQDLQMTGSGSLANDLANQNLALVLNYSLIVVASLPLLLAYPFVQKHFVKGMLIGSVKG